MELASCHTSGDENFQLLPGFLKNLCIPVVPSCNITLSAEECGWPKAMIIGRPVVVVAL